MLQWSPRGLDDLRREIDRLMTLVRPVIGEEEEGGSSKSPVPAAFWSPPVDIMEYPDFLEIVMELPGIILQDVGIQLETNTLIVKGERRYEPGREEKHYHRVERNYGPFQRTFNLPRNVNPDGIKAELKNGLLTVRLPKSEETKRRQIQIQAD